MIKKSVLLTALAIAGFAVTSLAQTVPSNLPTNGLVGWWPFNGNAIDESSNTNDGTVNGATLTADRFGNASSAYSFNGTNNFISVPDNISLDLLTNMYSLSVWFKIPDYSPCPSIPNGSGVLDDTRTLISKPRTSGWADGSIYLSFSPGINSDTTLGTGSWGIAGLSSNMKPPLNSWTNLIATYNGSLMNIYVDGILKNSISATGNLFQSSESLYFGKAFNTVGNNWYRWFKGQLDDIGIWNRALTQQEITGLYNPNICFQTITFTDTLLINTNITGFNPVTYQNTIKIWPNPTNDHITIDNGNLANLTGHQIKISNALGQQVFQSAITQQQFYVDMSTWGGNGIYFVNLINAQGVTIETRKIVLQ